MIDIRGKTHVGRRSLNEDRFVADAGWGIALVSDGMGGPAMGEVAAGIVTASLVDRLDEGQSLQAAVAATHADVLRAAEDGTGKPGMGATLVIARFDSYEFELAWIGDSRAYLWNGELRQLTRDHSQVERQLARGEITPDQARRSGEKHVITRAMGRNHLDADEVPVLRGTLGRGQRLLLCSDGLSDMLSGVEIAAIMAADEDAETTLDRLVGRAVEAGGADNITAVLVAAGDDAPAAAGLEQTPAVSIARADGYSEYFPPAG